MRMHGRRLRGVIFVLLLAMFSVGFFVFRTPGARATMPVRCYVYEQVEPGASIELREEDPLFDDAKAYLSSRQTLRGTPSLVSYRPALVLEGDLVRVTFWDDSVLAEYRSTTSDSWSQRVRRTSGADRQMRDRLAGALAASDSQAE